MIKRQFYSLEHRSRDNEASSSSSSEDERPSSSAEDEGASSSSSADEAVEQQEVSSPVHSTSDHEADHPMEENQDHHNMFSSGQWKSRHVDSYNNVQEDLSKDNGTRNQERMRSSLSNQWADLVAETLNDGAADFADDCVIRCKNVFKCRLCPKTICLTSETMRVHLASKKHVRSLKNLKEGNLKVMLNSDGEEEEQGETHAERHARIVASLQEAAVEPGAKTKRSCGRQRQRKRAKKKAQLEKSVPVTVQNEQRTMRVVKKKPSVPADGGKRKHSLVSKTSKVEIKKK